MRSSTGSPSTKRTDSPAGDGPGAAGAAFGPTFPPSPPTGEGSGGRGSVPPHLNLPRRPWLLAPACGVLIALCAVLVAWHTSPRADPAGFDLRAAPASPNVDSNSASAAGSDPAQPRQPPAREDGEPHITIGPLRPAPETKAPSGAQSAEPPTIELPPLPPPPGPTEGPRLPPLEVPQSHRDSPRGDDTMTHVTKLGLPIALAAALTAQPLATAGDVEKTPTPEKLAQDIKELKEAQKKSTDEVIEQLKAIRKQLDSAEGVRKDVDALKDAMRSLNSTLAQTQDALKTTQLSAEIKSTELAATQAQMKQLRDDLEKARSQVAKMEDQIKAGAARNDGLTEALADVRQRLADTSRQAARMSEPTGTIHLFNTSAQAASVVVNGRSYQLMPGETQTLANQAVGTVTYAVLGLSPQRTRTLAADRPLDIEVFDLARGPVRTPPAR